LNHKFGVNHSNRSGIVLNQHRYNVFNREAENLGDNLFVYADEDGSIFSAQAYTQSTIKVKDQLDLNLGLNLHYFELGEELSVEPRIGMKWQVNWRHSLAAAYGLNSRIEMIGFYLARQQTATGVIQLNKNMKMTKAHHFGLAYDVTLTDDTHLKIEPYYQYLFDVPVVEGSYFSLQNLDMNWFFNETLVNKGTGTNLGIDFTLEHFLSRGFYYLATA